jgi:hypothetical protein
LDFRAWETEKSSPEMTKDTVFVIPGRVAGHSPEKKQKNEVRHSGNHEVIIRNPNQTFV